MLFAWPLSGRGYGLAPFQLGIWTGPFPVGDMDWPLSGWGYGPTPAFTFIGIKNGTLTARQQSYNDVHGNTLSICLNSCGTSGVAALMSCTSLCFFCCISRNFAFRGRSVTFVMDHGTMSCIMFGLIKATRPPCKMKERMRQMCVSCVVRSVPPSQLVVSAKYLWGTNCYFTNT